MIFTPHPYQQHCIDKIIELPALALWLEMGLGKSVIALSAILRLKYDLLEVGKVLVVAPKKVAEATWQQEAGKWDHLRLLRLSTVLGNAMQRQRALATQADVYIINRDNLPWLVDYYQHGWPFDMVVLDESSSFKNQQSKRWKKLKAIRPYIRRILELTGTPAPQDLLDLWPQIWLLDQGRRLGRTVGSFREQYFTPDKRNATTVFTYKPREGTEQAVRALLADICISMKASDYLQLPPLLTDDIPVRLDPAAGKAYRQFEREMLLEVDETTLTAQSAAVLSGKLMQLCGGAVYDETGVVHTVHTCKLEALCEVMEQLAGEPALIFYGFRHEAGRILETLSGRGLRVRLYAGPQDQEDWNAGGRMDVLLAHPASCAYGLNLQQGGRHIIWYSPSWSQELTAQANARLYRQGQPRPVMVHRLVVQGGRDEDAIASVDNKTRTQDDLLESLKARIQSVKREDGYERCRKA